MDRMEITQFTYFQQAGSLRLLLVSVEITHGLERILMLLQGVDHFKKIRCEDRFVTVTIDGDPTADSELYNKLDRSIRDEHESQAIMKSYVVNSSDPLKLEKFLAYMVPAPDELSKDIYDESEDVLDSWVREYHWDVLAATQTPGEAVMNWFQGTTDVVGQFIWGFETPRIRT
ncbi:RNA polymerase II associated factor Paf1 protein [Dioscorea alata]|uniref:RNA polymerase II associated factor Paf1 protein n=1 Tax=Dioscorea alata TaxID=55571 RepID=A0ACB7VWI7_DIOAL|nr:RNA polymerase II associated factor Paf1 protein [Dioscorea alata]